MGRDRLQSKVNSALKEYGMIEDGDHVLIGLSGGKDSLALVEFLGARAKIFKPRFQVTALHVGVSNAGYKSDTEYLRRFCEESGVEFLYEETSFEADREERRSPCFLCAWSRRKVLFDTAKRMRCNKIALGHHQDDILETLLMNMVFQGSFSTMPPVMKMDRFEMTIIRPLALLREKELRTRAEERGYRRQEKNCPYEKVSNRTEIRALLEQMERLNPESANSLWSAMSNIKREYLPRRAEGEI